MINLITGTPGAGKTLNTIKAIHQEYKDTDRKIYYRGIRELAFDWEELTDEEITEWYNLPVGSVIVIDEVQQIWPNRSNSKPAPETVTRLDTHRHNGFDFYIITQKPTLVDFAARGFVDRHDHYERQFGYESCKRYSWEKAIDKPDSDHFARQEASVERIKYDKKYYDAYKSAEVHTVKKRVPKKLVFILFLIILFLGISVYAFARLSTKGENSPSGGDFSTEQFADIPFMDNSDFSGEDPVMTASEYAEHWKPRIESLPYSAPAYDAVTEVKTFPRPQCILDIKYDSCRCFTQQATPMDIEYAVCRRIVRGGLFNPFLDENQQYNERLAAGRVQDESATRPERTFDKVVRLSNSNKPHAYTGQSNL